MGIQEWDVKAKGGGNWAKELVYSVEEGEMNDEEVNKGKLSRLEI